jgi:preprotein translocase subunit SecB
VRIVLKDLSFEAPMGQDVFAGGWFPDYDNRLRRSARQLSDNLWEAILTATVDAKIDGRTAMLIEVHTAGVFDTAGQNDETVREFLAADALKLIFPYLQSTVEQVASMGGFPGVVLAVPPFRSIPEKDEAELD